MNEYIFEISEALYNKETGEAVMKPKYKGDIVRCKDCRYHKGYNCERLYGMQDAFTLYDDDYCSRAERKEE